MLPAMNTFKPVRKVLVSTQHLDAPPARVFPLLCPVREYEWIETWRADMVYSASGVAEEDCVFRTALPGQGEEMWVVSRYEPSQAIQFVRFGAERVMRYNITLQANPDGTTTAEWKQILTGCTEAGNRHVESCSEQAYRERIAALERMLNHYLSTGQMLRSARTSSS